MKLAAGERGQAITEFAVIAPIALLLIIGVLEFAQALFTYHSVAEAARAGTRYAIVHTANPANCADPAVGTAPCEQLFSAYMLSLGGLDPNRTTITYAWEGPSETCVAAANSGCYVQIQIASRFAFIGIPLLPPITLTSTSRMTM